MNPFVEIELNLEICQRALIARDRARTYFLERRSFLR
jgi:hypothetical protein